MSLSVINKARLGTSDITGRGKKRYRLSVWLVKSDKYMGVVCINCSLNEDIRGCACVEQLRELQTIFGPAPAQLQGPRGHSQRIVCSASTRRKLPVQACYAMCVCSVVPSAVGDSWSCALLCVASGRYILRWGESGVLTCIVLDDEPAPTHCHSYSTRQVHYYIIICLLDTIYSISPSAALGTLPKRPI